MKMDPTAWSPWPSSPAPVPRPCPRARPSLEPIFPILAFPMEMVSKIISHMIGIPSITVKDPDHNTRVCPRFPSTVDPAVFPPVLQEEHEWLPRHKWIRSEKEFTDPFDLAVIHIACLIKKSTSSTRRSSGLTTRKSTRRDGVAGWKLLGRCLRASTRHTCRLAALPPRSRDDKARPPHRGLLRPLLRHATAV